MTKFVTCDNCGSDLLETPEGIQYCSLCGWTRKDPTSSYGTSSYID